MESYRSRRFVLLILVVSAALLAVAPAVVGNGYSVTANTLSESAAQATRGAWVARGGFLLFGLGVLWLTAIKREWPPVARFLHGIFGVAMTTIAVFSHKPFVADVPYDQVEDSLHSVGATVIGFAFAAGVLVVSWNRIRRWRFLDILALAAAVLVPIAMPRYPEWDGILQRVMFLVAYVWYGVEAVRTGRGTVTT